MKGMPIVAIAAAALLCSAALAAAQDHKGPGGAGGFSGGPPAGAAPRGDMGGGRGAGPSSAPRMAPPARGPSEGHRAPRMSSPSGRELAPRPGRERPSARDVERRGYRSAEPKHERQQRSRAVERRRELRQHHRAAERERLQQRQRDRAAERKQQEKGVSGRAPDQKASPGRTTRPAQRHEQIRTARLQLSADQRTRLRASFQSNRRAHLTRVKFPHRIGHRLPRRVRLFAIPAAVLAILPDYSYYRYVWIDDDICIVDPQTYEIVDVIDEGGPVAPGSRPQAAELQLSPAERAIVLDSISPDFPSAPVKLRLALGAEIPRSVELHAFPGSVLDRIGRLAAFRFIVVEGDVVIVDPRDRSIALVVERR